MKPTFVLSSPWGLYDRRTGRQTLADGAVHLVPASGVLAVAIPSSAELRLSGRRSTTQIEYQGVSFGETLYDVHTLPTPVTEGHETVGVEIADGAHRLKASLQLTGGLARPIGATEDADAADDLNALLLAIVARIRDAVGDTPTKNSRRDVIATTVRWGNIASSWIEESQANRSAPMDVIVRHSETMPRLVAELAQHPRRVLRRVREVLPVGRIQEMDAASLIAFVRRPGRSIAEKAGTRQELLAVSRREDFDTPENRVLRDYLVRSSEAAAIYCRANRLYRSSLRWAVVHRHGMISRSMSRQLSSLGIAFPTPPARPNYVLLNDPRYHRLWVAYLELIRRKEEEDEIWRWQKRLWADFARLCVFIALCILPGQPLAQSPLLLRREQARGWWTQMAKQVAVHQLSMGPHLLMVSPINTQTPGAHPRIPAWLEGVCPTLVLDVDGMAPNKRGSVVIWTVHSTGSEERPLQELVQSAELALFEARDKQDLIEGVKPNVVGIVIASRRRGEIEVAQGHMNLVQGVAFGLVPDVLLGPLEALMKQIENRLSEICRCFAQQ